MRSAVGGTEVRRAGRVGRRGSTFAGETPSVRRPGAPGDALDGSKTSRCEGLQNALRAAREAATQRRRRPRNGRRQGPPQHGDPWRSAQDRGPAWAIPGRGGIPSGARTRCGARPDLPHRAEPRLNQLARARPTRLVVHEVHLLPGIALARAVEGGLGAEAEGHEVLAQVDIDARSLAADGDRGGLL